MKHLWLILFVIIGCASNWKPVTLELKDGTVLKGEVRTRNSIQENILFVTLDTTSMRIKIKDIEKSFVGKEEVPIDRIELTYKLITTVDTHIAPPSSPSYNYSSGRNQETSGFVEELIDIIVEAGGINGDNAIESQIDGHFEGWTGETIVQLMNGQIWKQTDFYYYYHYAFMPKVLVYKVNGRYKMKIDGIDQAVEVNQLK